MLSVKATLIGCARSWRQNSGLDKDQTGRDAQAEAKVVEEADDKEAATPASQAQTPIPMPATTPGSTATTSTAVGQEEEASLSQSPKSSTISRKRKKTTTSTPQARACISCIHQQRAGFRISISHRLDTHITSVGRIMARLYRAKLMKHPLQTPETSQWRGLALSICISPRTERRCSKPFNRTMKKSTHKSSRQ